MSRRSFVDAIVDSLRECRSTGTPVLEAPCYSYALDNSSITRAIPITTRAIFS